MRRVIGIDIHRTFGEVVFWEDGRLRRAGRIDMTRTALEGFGKSLLAQRRGGNRGDRQQHGGLASAGAIRGAGDHRQSAAGEGDRPGSRKDGQICGKDRIRDQRWR
jgi:hypothetical protein